MNDVIASKKASLERCVEQVRSYYQGSGDIPFARDWMRQDAIAMNLQRAAELAIDMANHLIKIRKLGLPADSRQSFALLAEQGILDRALSEKLQAMVGFRNILVHEYTRIDLEIVQDVIRERLDDLIHYSELLVKAI